MMNERFGNGGFIMTLGEKLSKLRKENNYTQEQLADILGVSRQAISKWESNVTYPETDKLIRMSSCSAAQQIIFCLTRMILSLTKNRQVSRRKTFREIYGFLFLCMK